VPGHGSTDVIAANGVGDALNHLWQILCCRAAAAMLGAKAPDAAGDLFDTVAAIELDASD